MLRTLFSILCKHKPKKTCYYQLSEYKFTHKFIILLHHTHITHITHNTTNECKYLWPMFSKVSHISYYHNCSEIVIFWFHSTPICVRTACLTLIFYFTFGYNMQLGQLSFTSNRQWGSYHRFQLTDCCHTNFFIF